MDIASSLRVARASDASRALIRAADAIARVAPDLDAISQNTLDRMAANLRTIAKLQRPRDDVERAHFPGDVNF